VAFGIFIWGLNSYAHTSLRSACESLLEAVQAHDTLVEEAVDFEVQLEDLEASIGGKGLREAQTLRADFNMYVEDLLERKRSLPELLGLFAQISVREHALRTSLNPPEDYRVEPGTPTILEFAEKPEALIADVPLATGNEKSFIRFVTFSGDLLSEFQELALPQQTKFLRAIFTGIVGPVGESGVKYLHFISKHLVEVKTFGGGSRLLGCLKSGRLTVLKLLPQHVHRRTSLMRYRLLCD
jgi:hypothetical protein